MTVRPSAGPVLRQAQDDGLTNSRCWFDRRTMSGWLRMLVRQTRHDMSGWKGLAGRGDGWVDFQTCRAIVAASMLREYYGKGTKFGRFFGKGSRDCRAALAMTGWGGWSEAGFTPPHSSFRRKPESRGRPAAGLAGRRSHPGDRQKQDLRD